MKDESIFLTTLEFMTELRAKVKQFASQKDAAQAFGVSESYLSDVILGWRQPGAKLYRAAGYERVTMYMKVKP